MEYRIRLIEENDKLMLTGIFLFIVGGMSLATGSLPITYAFLFALGGCLMYVGAAFALASQVRLINESAEFRR